VTPRPVSASWALRAGWRGIGAALVLCLATGVAAQDVPSWRDRITFTVNDRVRGEFVDWFTPHEGKAQPGAERYNFVANRFRAGVRVLLPPAELNLQLQDTELGNLPENASLPAPIGNLGPGAIYFANRRTSPQGEVFRSKERSPCAVGVSPRRSVGSSTATVSRWYPPIPRSLSSRRRASPSASSVPSTSRT
jgi:hypothetical protein